MADSILIEAYLQIGVPLDQLPYSDGMNRVRELVERRSGQLIEKRGLWQRLLRLRKGGKLPRLRRV